MSTRKDVAAAAGISPAVVSIVLTNRPSTIRISEATRKRVLQAARELNYRPHAFARALACRRAHALGMAVYDPAYLTLPESPFALIFHEAFDAAQRLRHHLTLCATHSDFPAQDEFYIVNMAAQHRVDGLVVWDDYVTGETLRQIVKDYGVPVVIIGRKVPDMPDVSVDDTKGVCLACRYLIELGHQRIALLFGGRTTTVRTESWPRSWGKALSDSGIEPDPSLVMNGHDPLCRELAPLESACQRVRELLDRTNPPTAILCGSDQDAINGVKALHRYGLEVPRDCSVVGFGGIPFGAEFMPGLTTVKVPYGKMSRRAVEMVLRLVEGKHIRSAEEDCELIVRETTAPPPLRPPRRHRKPAAVAPSAPELVVVGAPRDDSKGLLRPEDSGE